MTTVNVSLNDKQIKMKVRPGTKDERIIQEVIIGRAYRQSRIKFDVAPEETWVDLGAHIGCFSVYALLMGAKVKAYEPEPDNHALLCHNLKQAEHDLRRYQITRATVSAYKNRTLPLYGPTRRVEGTLPNTKYMIDGMESYQRLCDVTNLQFNSVFLHGVNGVKMDIEGAEAGILDNLPKIPPSVTKMVIEYHFIKDRCLKKFKYRMDNLRKQFSIVKYPAHLDRFIREGLAEYPGYFDRLVFCKR